MYKQLTSVAVFVAMIFCLLSPFSVSAEDVVLSNDELASSMYDELVSYYGLSGDFGEDIIYYIYGRKNGGTGNPRSSLWVGVYSYHCSYDLQTGTYSYSKGTFAIQLYDSYVGRSELGSAYWYEPTSSQMAFISGWTDNIRISEIYPNNNWTQSKSVSFEEFGSSLGGSSDPTEPTAPGGFELPDSWINGGETLTPVEPITFESYDLDGAIDDFEDIEATAPNDVMGAVGAFWYIFDGFISATGLMWLVIISLVFVLLAWFFGRRV